MILKGCEQTLNSVDSPLIIVSVVICICSPSIPALSNNDSTQRECAEIKVRVRIRVRLGVEAITATKEGRG